MERSSEVRGMEKKVFVEIFEIFRNIMNRNYLVCVTGVRGVTTREHISHMPYAWAKYLITWSNAFFCFQIMREAAGEDENGLYYV
jgi:hypothetical protein